jgi:putative ABC transport system permease protein
MWREIFFQALNSIKGNRLRTAITITIIAVGITSLVGTLTAARGLENSLGEGFGKMGAGSFFIRGGGGDAGRGISYREVCSFKAQYICDALVSPYVKVDTGLDGVSADGKRSGPEVEVVAADGSFVEFNGGTISLGRNFSPVEERGGADIALLGSNVAGALFGGTLPSEVSINVRGCRFRVVGVLAEMGTGASSLDNMVIVPIESARKGLLDGREPFVIGVLPRGAMDTGSAVDEAVAVMRRVRRLPAGEEDDFRIRRRDSAISQMESMMGMVTLAAFMIGFITLTGAAVGLMNIMLVSVRERSSEIGLLKAIGATDVAIKWLFLTEALLIGLIGGLFGVVFGLVAGGVVSMVLEISFVVPWGWIGVSLAVSMAVCLISGSLPAGKAAALPPVEALRGE